MCSIEKLPSQIGKGFTREERVLHVRVKLLLAVCGAVALALQSADTLESLTWLARKDVASAHFLNEPGLLHLLLKPLLQAVIGLFAFLDCVNSHR